MKSIQEQIADQTAKVRDHCEVKTVDREELCLFSIFNDVTLHVDLWSRAYADRRGFQYGDWVTGAIVVEAKTRKLVDDFTHGDVFQLLGLLHSGAFDEILTRASDGQKAPK